MFLTGTSSTQGTQFSEYQRDAMDDSFENIKFLSFKNS